MRRGLSRERQLPDFSDEHIKFHGTAFLSRQVEAGPGAVFLPARGREKDADLPFSSTG